MSKNIVKFNSTEKGGDVLKKILTNLTKRQKLSAACIVSLIPIILTVCILLYNNLTYEIFVNDTSIGYVQDRNEYKLALKELTETDGSDSIKNIDIKTIYSFNKNDPEGSSAFKPAQASARSIEIPSADKNNLKASDIESIARDILKLKKPSFSISVGGTSLVSVSAESDLDAIREIIKKHYTPSDDSLKVNSVEIHDEMTIAPSFEYQDKVLPVEQAAEKILEGKPVEETYTVVSGDTIWDIALKYDISVDDIQNANPNLTIDKIQIDDKITIKRSEPYALVTVDANLSSLETVPYDTKEVDDNTLTKGKTKVTQPGKNGSAEITTNLTIVNKRITAEKILSNKVVTQPQTKIVSVGTKVVTVQKPSTPSRNPSSTTTKPKPKPQTSTSTPSSSSKGFIRPASGIITSNYGWRSRGFHTGVDFASSRGTSIVASKSGKVTFAGWKGGYGLCVIIDHGGGISTLYAHNGSLKVKVGQSVSQGQRIALMGSTGNSTGPHVHFEVRVNGAHKNPFNYIR